VPSFIPGAALINASQRAGADTVIAWDQHSWSLGTSYSFSANSILKAEYMRSHIGQMSSMVDAPPGGNIREPEHQRVLAFVQLLILMSARRHSTRLRTVLVALALVAGDAPAAGGVVVIGDARLARLDAPTVERIYLGRVIEVDGVHVTAVNANSGTTLRNRFLQAYVKRDDDAYTGYWNVRRYSGLGAPPARCRPAPRSSTS
jgi:hypothetical protein